MANVAAAQAASPQWTITSVSRPTNFQPGDQTGHDSYKVTLTNTGDAPSTGPVQVTDELPPGLSPDPAGPSGESPLAAYQHLSPTAGFTCSLDTCTYTGSLVPGQTIDLTFPVDVTATEPTTLTNVVRASGGGGSPAVMRTPTAISTEPAPFGIAPGSTTTAISSLQAGAHPDITNTIGFDTTNSKGSLSGDPKDVTYRLPPGFASDFAETPTCSAAQFLVSQCPIGSQVGVTTILGNLEGPLTYTEAVYNLVPDRGTLAAIGFSVGNEFNIQGDITLRPHDFGADVTFANVNEVAPELDSASLTVWGLPADPSHNPLRAENTTLGPDFGHPSGASPTPYFTNPTSCGAQPLQSEFQVDSWQHPAVDVAAQMSYGPFVGCDRLTIEPAIETQTTANSAETATGLNVTLESPPALRQPLRPRLLPPRRHHRHPPRRDEPQSLLRLRPR